MNHLNAFESRKSSSLCLPLLDGPLPCSRIDGPAEFWTGPVQACTRFHAYFWATPVSRRNAEPGIGLERSASHSNSFLQRDTEFDQHKSARSQDTCLCRKRILFGKTVFRFSRPPFSELSSVDERMRPIEWLIPPNQLLAAACCSASVVAVPVSSGVYLNGAGTSGSDEKLARSGLCGWFLWIAKYWVRQINDNCFFHNFDL